MVGGRGEKTDGLSKRVKRGDPHLVRSDLIAILCEESQTCMVP